jgi:hypothetical protein
LVDRRPDNSRPGRGARGTVGPVDAEVVDAEVVDAERLADPRARPATRRRHARGSSVALHAGRSIRSNSAAVVATWLSAPVTGARGRPDFREGRRAGRRGGWRRVWGGARKFLRGTCRFDLPSLDA